jgi:cell division protease FtsH
VRRLVGEAYDRAREILKQYREKLDAVAQKLLEVETISREEFESIFPPPATKNGGTPMPMIA